MFKIGKLKGIFSLISHTSFIFDVNTFFISQAAIGKKSST